MTEYTITQAKKNFERLLEQVRSGEPVIIKRRSKPIALVLDIPSQDDEPAPNAKL